MYDKDWFLYSYVLIGGITCHRYLWTSGFKAL